MDTRLRIQGYGYRATDKTRRIQRYCCKATNKQVGGLFRKGSVELRIVRPSPAFMLQRVLGLSLILEQSPSIISISRYFEAAKLCRYVRNILSPAQCSGRTPTPPIPTMPIPAEGEPSEGRLSVSSPDPSLPISNATSRKRNRPDDDHPQKLLRRRIACQRCRARKVKCDNVRPCCGFCDDSGRQCVYVDTGKEKPLYVSHGFVSFTSTDDRREATIPPQLMSRLDQILAGVQDITASLRPQGMCPWLCGMTKFHKTSRSAEVLLSRCTDSGHGKQMQEPVSDFPRYSEISSATSGFQQTATIDDTQKDYLRIPTTNTTADSILTWPIFAGEYPPEYLTEAILGQGEDDNGDAFVVRHGGLEPLSDERIPSLIDRFLRNVHTKNPILDVDALLQYGRTAAETGPGWDAPSCLVLLACALGSISFSLESSIANQAGVCSAGSTPTSASTYKRELRQGESCYALACRRLGLLKHTILGAQCYFFSAGKAPSYFCERYFVV